MLDMIFLAIHTHDADKCVSKDPLLVKKFQEALSNEVAEKNGCKLKNVYVNPAEHVAYILFEADEYNSVMGFLKPLFTLGVTKISPVDEWKRVSNSLIEK
jgi:hypothetical protein